MEENVKPSDHQIQRRGGTPGKNQRYPVENEDEGPVDSIKCSGKSCQSCTAGLIADCVAVCCCPCAVVDILALAFLKVPWMMGRKCLGLGKKKKKNKKKCCKEIDRDHEMGAAGQMEMEMDIDRISWEEKGEEGTSGIITPPGFEDELGEKDNNYSARFEAEKVWLELYQIGHLGFGRVSFTGNGTQSIGKGNSGN